jgi:hypothetical protein
MNSHAKKIIETLVRRTEENPERVRGATQRVDEQSIAPLDLDDFHRSMKEAEKIGGIALEWGKREESHILQRVRLVDLEKSCRVLGRLPAKEDADTSVQQVRKFFNKNDTWINELINEMHRAWCRRKSAFSLDVNQIDDAVTAIRVVSAIKNGLHDGLDMRTFSRRAVGDSKAIESVLGPIVAICRQEFDLHEIGHEQVLQALGLRKFPQPVLVSGDLKLAHTNQSLSSITPYIGLPPADDYPVQLASHPAYVLTIENLTSFNRYVREISDGGLVIYTGGYPSHAVGAFIAKMSKSVEYDVPWFHWGDIDADGILILDKISLLSNRPVTPHLMSPDIAAEKGQLAPASRKLQQLNNGDSSCHEIAAYLSSEKAHVLEQEELDPKSPITL